MWTLSYLTTTRTSPSSAKSLLPQPIPAILEIPSKDTPYDPSKDSILSRVRGMFNEEAK